MASPEEGTTPEKLAQPWSYSRELMSSGTRLKGMSKYDRRCKINPSGRKRVSVEPAQGQKSGFSRSENDNMDQSYKILGRMWACLELMLSQTTSLAADGRSNKSAGRAGNLAEYFSIYFHRSCGVCDAPSTPFRLSSAI